MEIHVDEWGHGPRVVLVHGNMSTGPATWKMQRELAEHWTLVVPTRRGHVPNPPVVFGDYEVDAEDVASLLGDGAHLVGHSLGGLVAILAAARRPEAVRSLCLLEPLTSALVRGDPQLEDIFATRDKARASTTDPREYMLAALSIMGSSGASLPDPLPAEVEQHVRLTMNERPPEEASIPVEVIASIPSTKVVVSGGHIDWQEKLSDAAATAFGAERVTLPGAGHLVPRAPGCNELLKRVWST